MKDDTRAAFEDVLGVYGPVMIATAVVVIGAFLAMVLIFRRRTRAPADGPREHPVAEGLYALALLAIAVTLVTVTFRAEGREEAADPRPGLAIDATAARWHWRFDYPDAGVVQVGADGRPAELVVPADTTIRFTLRATDVIHSFFVPQLRFKRDMIPGTVQTVDLRFTRAGRLDGACAEFCGLDHAAMVFDVVAMPPDAFASWIAARRAGAPG
jgi:cytochrome c oxidase subunit 2